MHKFKNLIELLNVTGFAVNESKIPNDFSINSPGGRRMAVRVNGTRSDMSLCVRHLIHHWYGPLIDRMSNSDKTLFISRVFILCIYIFLH